MNANHRVDLNVPFNEKDQAKLLGAKWDGRTWYIPPGLSLEPFSRWLSDGLKDPRLMEIDSQSDALSLSQYLLSIHVAIKRQVSPGQWVTAEITELRKNSGHIYLTLGEHDDNGNLLARSRASIWRNTATWLMDKFSTATGGQLQADMKIMIKVSADFHVLHGFNLVVEDVDPSYTLGDLAAKLKYIRESLIKQGIFDNNRKLTPATEFVDVAVIAPYQAAGLGDFRREADLLQKHDLCQFDYFYAVFQGSHAAEDVKRALDKINQKKQHYDAVVIIRGGGAVTDLAWLNDESLAQSICLCTVPLYSGIGHERDNTIIDEVACVRFDTPSKVIQHIFQTIKQNALDAINHVQEIQLLSKQMIATARQVCERDFQFVESAATHNLDLSLRATTHQFENMLATASHDLQYVRNEIDYVHTYFVDTGQALIQNLTAQLNEICSQLQLNIQQDLLYQTQIMQQSYQNITDKVGGLWQQSMKDVQTRMKYVFGLAPEQTLRRGFVIVRDLQGKPVTRSKRLTFGKMLQLQFYDGNINVKEVKNGQDQ